MITTTKKVTKSLHNFQEVGTDSYSDEEYDDA